MISPFNGPYAFNTNAISMYAPNSIGVYYLGERDGSDMTHYYIGKAARGDSSIRDRLFSHLYEEKWPDVTCFGFRTTTTAKEADELEESEIKKYKPKYNQVGKMRAY